MRLDRVVELLAPRQVVGRPLGEIADLAYDTRAVRPGALFFAVPGARVDGHDLAADAVAAGATALVVERPVTADVPQLVVESVRTAMPAVAAEFFGHPSRELPVAAVTGTNGKTTTAFVLHSILEAAGLEPGLLGNIERRVGADRRPSGLNTPEAIDLQRLLREMLTAGNRCCVIEASSHASTKHRLDGVRFAALAFTNLSRDHLDFHGSMESYFEAKRRLFLDGEPPPAAVNLDDPWGQRLAGELRSVGRQPVLTFGAHPEADVRAEEWSLEADGGRLRSGTLTLRTGLRGRYNLQNVLAAVATARLLEVPDEAIVDGVERLDGVAGRLERVDAGQPFSVFVDYAHTPDSLEAVLRSVRELIGAGRVLCVFGAGGDRDRGKRSEMGRVVAKLADVAIVTSDNPRGEDPAQIAAEVTAGVEHDLVVELDRREAIARAVGAAEPGDAVVITGKGHETGQEIAGAVQPFDDRDEAREALRRLVAASA